MAVQRLSLTRDQFASFLQDFEQIKQFERLFSTVDTINTVTLDEINVSAGSAFATANEALAQISGISTALDSLLLAPRNELGTISAQNSENVNITGGLISGLDVPLPVASGGTGQTSYTDGQLLIGNTTGNTLTKATLTAGMGIAITNGSGSVTIAATGGTGTVTSVGLSGGTTGLTATSDTTNPITTSGTFTLGGTLVAVNGGTGLSSYAVGDILFASTTTELSRLADVTTGNALISGGVGVAPSYGKIGLTTHVSGTLPIANGGTNSTSTATAGGVAYGTGTAIVVNAAGPAGYVLTSGGAAPPVWTPVASLAVGTSAYWGSFWDTTTQTAPAPNTAYILTLNSADPTNNGVTVVSGSRVTFTHAGVYSLTFSIQFENGDNANAAHDANVWLRKNDSGSAGDVPDSDSKFTIPAKHAGVKGSLIGTVNFVLTLAAGDFIELVYAVSDVAVLVASLPAGTSPVSPRIPSIIFTAVAAAPVGLGYAGVESFTSLTVGTGSKTFTVNTSATDTAFIVGNRVRLVNSSTNYMDGVITAYSGTSMTVLVDGTAGSGTYTAWFVTLTGSVGGVTSFSGNSTGLTPATPTVGAISLAGTLNVANGGTGQTTYTNGQLLIGNTTGNTLAKATLTAGTNVSITNGAGAITINATDQFTGTVTSVSGAGTVNGITLTGTVTSSGSLTLGGTLSGVSLTTQVSGTLPIANGGTNSTATPTAGGVAYGTGTAYAVNSAGTSGQVLTSAGAGAPTWTTPTTGTVTSVGGTGTVNGITLTGTVTSSGSLTLGGTLSGVSLTTQVSGTLPVANGGTGVTTSTGTVAVVLSNTPTLVTPILGAATATSIANGLGAVGTPSYTFTGDLNTGMWSPAADTIAFSNGGVEATRITSAGLMGIGTTAPVGRLMVAAADTSNTIGSSTASINITNTDSGAFGRTANLNFTIDNGNIATRRLATISAVYVGFGGGSTEGALAFATQFNGSLSERMRIGSDGGVGIGATANASALLDVQSTTKGFRLPNMTTAQKNAIATPAAGLMVFDTTLAKACVYSGAAWQTITSI